MEHNTSEPFSEEERKARNLLEEKEPESKLRTFTGPLGNGITVLFLIWAAFQVYANTFGMVDAMALRTWHLFFLLGFTFLLFPTFSSERRTRRLPPIWDLVLLALTIGTFAYLLHNYTVIARRGGYLLTNDLVIAGVAIVLLFEGGATCLQEPCSPRAHFHLVQLSRHAYSG